MKKLLALLSGFCLTLLIFAGGGITAIAFLTSQPKQHGTPLVKTAIAATDDVVTVHKPAKDDGAEKGEAVQQASIRPMPQPSDEAADEDPRADMQERDLMTTASFNENEPADTPDEAPAATVNARHVAWCSQHYRSYDPSDNRYNSYSGERRECVSPFADGAESTDEGAIIQASSDGSSGFISSAQADEMPAATMDSQHIQACYDRYRSYRAEDNSYQPYGGGPRQQCE